MDGYTDTSSTTGKYCKARDNGTCECGKAHMQIAFCGKPFSQKEMQRIFDKLRIERSLSSSISCGKENGR